MSERKVPKIRFPGFTDDWEQREFGELYEKIIEKNDLSFGPERIISVANMYFKEDAKISDDEYLRTYNIMRLGDIAFEGNKSKYYAHGRFVENTIGDGIVSHVFDVFRPIAEYDLFFWKYLINNESVMGRIMTRCTKSSTMMTNLVANDFLKEMIFIPSIEEQNRIGAFLVRLDDLITLHQRELDKWKELKKGMLQKMFPKEGKSVPEIRFPAYEAKWSKRKLGDCANFRRGSFPQPYGKKEWYDGDNSMPFVQVADVCDNMRLADITKQRISILAQPMSVFAPEGSVLVTLQGSIGRVAITQYAAYVDRTVLIFEEYDKSINKEFWAYIICQKFVDEAKRAPGGTIKTITKEVLSNFELYIPEYNEQKEIAILLLFIDRNIAICENELGKVLRLKKSLLQQMFVA